MDQKKLIWFGLFVGSAVGSFLPVIWGGSELSFSSIILSAVGGLAGIWFGFKMGQ